MGKHRIPNRYTLRRGKKKKKSGAPFSSILHTSGLILHNKAPAQWVLGMTNDNGDAFLGESNDGEKKENIYCF